MLQFQKIKTLRTWTFKGEPLQVFSGHDGDVNKVVFSHDGNLIATASQDKTIQIWDHNTGKRVAVLKGHEKTITGLVFSKK